MPSMNARVWNGETFISPDYITRDGFAFWRENSILEKSKEIMYGSGMKDSKGEEVFDGDILLGGYTYNDDKKPRFVVAFLQGAFRVHYIDKDELKCYESMKDHYSDLISIRAKDKLDDVFSDSGWEPLGKHLLDGFAPYRIVSSVPFYDKKKTKA